MSSWRDRIIACLVNRIRREIPLELPPVNTELDDRKLLLHLACGFSDRHRTVKGFLSDDWREWRLDADVNVMPDIVGSMTDLSAIAENSVDAIYSSHGIEHLYWHEVPLALAEWYRVLKPDGFVVITCPDLQAAAQLIAEDRVFETAYDSSAGAITPFDIVFSYRPFVEKNPRWMAHHCGFTLTTLRNVLRDAGFASITGYRRAHGFDLWVLASKSVRSEPDLSALADDYLKPWHA